MFNEVWFFMSPLSKSINWKLEEVFCEKFLHHLLVLLFKKPLFFLRSDAGGTTLITLLVPPGPDRLTWAGRLAAAETSAASCIKSRATRQAVQVALASLGHKIKTFKKIPENGLVFFCGSVEGKKVSHSYSIACELGSIIIFEHFS